MIQKTFVPVAMNILCRQCESRLEEGAVVCPTCGCAVEEPARSEFVPVQAVETSTEAAPHEAKSAPRVLIEPLPDTGPAYREELDTDLIGIGGWLILPAIGLAISPFLFFHGVYSDLHLLTGAAYKTSFASRPGLFDLVIFESINNSVLLLATIGLNVLFYGKKKAFPLFMMLYLGGQFLLGFTDQLMALQFNPHSSWTQVVRGFIGAAIWIPYLLQSRRVEVTFVN
jgi:hypothetical protein